MVLEVFNFKTTRCITTPLKPRLPAVTLFRTYRNHPSIFYISSFCNPFFCQRENSKPRALSPSSVQWECVLTIRLCNPQNTRYSLKRYIRSTSSPVTRRPSRRRAGSRPLAGSSSAEGQSGNRPPRSCRICSTHHSADVPSATSRTLTMRHTERALTGNSV